MTITSNDIHFFQSENMTNEDNGGGRATGIKVDGDNLLDKISSVNRATGAVDMVKVHVGVETETTEKVNEANVILADRPADPNVNVLLFNTKDPADRRKDAQELIESYLTAGVEADFYLYGSALTGSRSFTVLQTLDREQVQVGEAYAFRDPVTGDTEFFRVNKAESSEKRFYPYNDGSAARLTLRETVVEAVAPLRHDWPGSRPNAAGAEPGKTTVLTTQVSDRAKYYGASHITKAISAGEKELHLAQLYQPLVPAASNESSIVNIKAGTPGTLLLDASTDAAVTVTEVVALTAGQERDFHVGSSVFALVEFRVDSYVFTDPNTPEGELEGSAPGVSKVVQDRAAGRYTLVADQTRTVTVSVQFKPAVNVTELAFTHAISVTEGGQGYSYAPILSPPPYPKTLAISYMVDNKWYSISDQMGDGNLTGAGGGRVDYVTGSVPTTLSRLPDVDTPILYSWADSSSYDKPVSAEASLASSRYTLGQSVKPGSLTLTWGANDEYSLTDDGSGLLTGDGSGVVLYSEGVMDINPNHASADMVATYTTFDDGASGIEELVMPGVVSGSGVEQVLTATHSGEALTFGSVIYFKGKYLEGTKSGGIQDRYALYTAYTDYKGGTDTEGDYVFVLLRGVQYRHETEGATVRGFNWLTRYKRVIGRYYPALKKYVLYLEFAGSYRVQRFNTATGAWDYLGTGFYEWDGSVSAARLKSEVSELPVTAPVTLGPVEVNVDTGNIDSLVEGSLVFSWGGEVYVDRSGSLYKNISPLTGIGELVGSVDYEARRATISQPPAGDLAPDVVLHSAMTRRGVKPVNRLQFRTVGAPVVPEKCSINITALDGSNEIVVPDATGAISGEFTTGQMTFDNGYITLSLSKDVDPNQILYNVVVGSTLPLDPEIIGLDAVRLPRDGEVKVFDRSDIVVIANTQRHPVTPAAGAVETLPRSHQALITVQNTDGVALDGAQYTVDLTAGKLTFADPLVLQDVAGNSLSGPFEIVDRVEDMTVLTDVQITGKVQTQKALAHDYPIEGSVVSSAVVFGDLFARVFNEHSARTWEGVWPEDAQTVEPPTSAAYDFLNHPIEVMNKGAVTERWALVFRSASTFDVVGETLGVVATGSTSEDVMPINPNTGTPYFAVRANGFGLGWAAGNAVPFETEGALAPLWVIRAVMPADAVVSEDQVQLMHRGG